MEGQRTRFLVALAIGGRLGAEIDGLRRALSSRDLERIAPHITLVPPTNVSASSSLEVGRHLGIVAGSSGRFELALGPAATFPENRRVLFLSVASSPPLAALRGALCAGPFEGSGGDRAFVPHVTLVSRREPFVDAELLGAFSGFNARFAVTSLQLFVQPEGIAGSPWVPEASFDLAPPPVIGRGGYEVTLRSALLSSERASSLVFSIGAGALEEHGSGVHTLVASVGGDEVGILCWSEQGSVGRISAHVVAPRERGLGVGTRLLSELESLGAQRGLSLIRVEADLDSAAEGYYRGRGFQLVATLSGATPLVVLDRAL